jgi:hypothetical protein
MCLLFPFVDVHLSLLEPTNWIQNAGSNSLYVHPLFFFLIASFAQCVGFIWNQISNEHFGFSSITHSSYIRFSRVWKMVNPKNKKN